MLIAYTSTWRLQKPVGKDAMRRSHLQGRVHHVELLPSAAAQPWLRQIIEGCSFYLQQNFSLKLSRGCGAKAIRVCHPALPKDWEAALRDFTQDQSKHICSACPEGSLSTQVGYEEVTVIYKDKRLQFNH